LTIYIHSSTNPENLAKIGPVDVAIFGLTEIIKNTRYKINNEQQQDINPPAARRAN